MRIGRDHPLRHLFSGLVWQHCFVDLQLPDPRVARYIADLLTGFTHVDSLDLIRNARGKPLEDIARGSARRRGAIDLRRPED